MSTAFSNAEPRTLLALGRPLLAAMSVPPAGHPERRVHEARGGAQGTLSSPLPRGSPDISQICWTAAAPAARISSSSRSAVHTKKPHASIPARDTRGAPPAPPQRAPDVIFLVSITQSPERDVQ